MGSQHRVAVLLGGGSAQREISLASGISIAAALEEAGHFPYAVDTAEVDLVEINWQRFDACFFALLGADGESGCTQRLLDQLHVPFTGSGSRAVACAVSKSTAKEQFNLHGVPTPPSTIVHAGDPIGRITARAERLGYPLVIKPDAQGLSLGVSVAHQRDELERAVAHAQFYDKFLLAERYVPGREFACCFLNRRPLPPVEVLLTGELFTHEAKCSDDTEYVFDSDLPAGAIERMQKVALAAVEAIDTAGLVRVDVRWDPDGCPWVLELNTTPELTPRSTAARAAARAGIELSTLCDRLLRDSLLAEAPR